MSRPLHPLLPETTKQDRGPPVGSVQKAKPKSQACESCRRSKIKCDGGRPTCGACLTRRTHCRYVATIARQATQKYKDLRASRSNHEELVRLLGTLPESDALELFRRVRSGDDLATTLSRFRDGDLLLQTHLVPETRLKYDLPYSMNIPAVLLASGSSYLNSPIYESTSQHSMHAQENGVPVTEYERASPASVSSANQIQYVRPYHAAVLIEPRLDRAKPSEWTTVCKNDVLLREILTAYFMHEYHLFPIFHKDYFFEDMQSPRTNKRDIQFCSALLVNAILAYGCYCSRRFGNRFRYWDPDSLGYRFLAEAKRLWEVQSTDGNRPKLVSVQGVMIINVVLNLHGLDKQGDLYGLRGLAIAKDMGLFGGSQHITSKRDRHARDFTAWCLFNMDTHLKWHFFHPPFLIEPPIVTLPDPSTDPAWFGESWHRYPSSSTLLPTQFPQFFSAKSAYITILNEIGHRSFGNESGLLIHETRTFARRLIRWFQLLPMVLSPKHIVLPAHFLLHLDYHIVLMTICQPFIQEAEVEGVNFRSIVNQSERDINILLRLYYIRHSFSGADSWLSNPLAKLGFMSLQRINETTSPQDIHYLRSGLILALQGLREQGRNYYITRTAYYIIRNQVRPEEAKLLQGTEDATVAADESPGLVIEVQSAWIPSVVDISDDLTDKELSKLAKDFLTLELDRPSDHAPEVLSYQ